MIIQRPGQDDRELALRKYFKGLPEKPSHQGAVACMVIGSIIALVGLLAYFLSRNGNEVAGCGSTLALVMAIVGLVLLAIGALWRSSLGTTYEAALQEVMPQPSDGQVDRWIYESVQRVILHSKGVLNLSDQESTVADPVLIVSPTLRTTEGIPADDVAWRRGDDKKVRFSIYNVVVIHLTDRHLGAFACTLNFIRDVPLNEITREYHYRDVVAVSTVEASQSYSLPTGEKLTTTKAFKLAVPNESFEVTIDVDQIRKVTGEEGIPETGADRAVSTIRTMLRDKKA